jgi:hypothetical protein
VPISLNPISAADSAALSHFQLWCAEARMANDRGPVECQGILDALNARIPNTVIHGVYVDSALVGGILTARENFNVIWIHWDFTRRGIGPHAAHEVLSMQLRTYGSAIVNRPNLKFQRTLAKIITPSAARRPSAPNTVSLVRGDLVRLVAHASGYS